MLLFVAGIVLFIICRKITSVDIKSALIIAGIIMVAISIFPVQGFGEPECIEEVELLPLEGKQGSYLEDRTAVYRYAYDNREEYDLEGLIYEEDVCSKGISKVYYSEDCTIPVMRIYKLKANTGIFSLGIWWPSKEYIFYLPAIIED